MQNFSEALGKNFERLLRWLYPGVLFLVLLHLSGQRDLIPADNVGLYSWPIVIGGITVGAAVYLIQMYIVTQFISFIVVLIRWDVNALVDNERPIGDCRFAKFVDRYARAIEARWRSSPQGTHSYLDYAWATYHAASITGWLALAFFCSRGPDSVLDKLGGWVVVVPSSLLLVGALWEYLQLSRVRRF